MSLFGHPLSSATRTSLRRTEGDDQSRNEIVKKRSTDTEATRGGLIRRTHKINEKLRMVTRMRERLRLSQEEKENQFMSDDIDLN